MTRVLILLWPALLPLIGFLIWHLFRKSSAKKRNEISPLLKDGPWFQIVVASMIIAVLSLLAGGLLQEENKGTYQPAHMENGVLHEGQIIRE